MKDFKESEEMYRDTTSIFAKLYGDEVDVYKLAASKLYEVPMDEVTPQQRSVAKLAVYKALYGAGVIDVESTSKSMTRVINKLEG